MTKLIVAILLAGACTAQPTTPVGVTMQPGSGGWGPPPPSYAAPQPAAGQPTGDPWAGGAQPSTAIAGGTMSSCAQIVTCYSECDQMTEDCLGACDQRGPRDGVESAHAQLRCFASSGCQDTDCAVQKCEAELTACVNGTAIAAAPAAPATTRPAPSTGGATGGWDLVYSVPAGWTETRTNDAIVLAYKARRQADTDFYGVHNYQLLILPSRPFTGTLADEFRAVWNAEVAGAFKTTLQPGPMRRRLASGLVVGADGEFMDGKQGGYFYVALYLVVAGDRAVPVIGMYQELDGGKLEPVLVPFFDAVSIRGGKPSNDPLYEDRELAGVWDTNSLVLGSYVNSAGGYVGDASVASSETIHLNANKTFTGTYISVKASGPIGKYPSKGKWKIEGGDLVLDKGGGQFERRLIRGIAPAPGAGKGNTALLLEPNFNGSAHVDFTQPRGSISAEWFGVSK